MSDDRGALKSETPQGTWGVSDGASPDFYSGSVRQDRAWVDREQIPEGWAPIKSSQRWQRSLRWE